MPSARAFACLCAAGWLLAAGPAPAFADTWGEVAKGGCEDLVKEAVYAAVEHTGGELASAVDDFVMEPLVAFFTNPAEADNPKDARAQKLILQLVENGFKLVFKPYGLLIDGGRVFIGGSAVAVEALIDEARHLQLVAMIEGSTSFGNPFSRVSFWDTSALGTGPGRITKDNIGEKIADSDQLKKLWFDIYGRQLKDIFSAEKDEVQKILDEAWPLLKEYWELKRINYVLDRLADALEAEARKYRAAADCKSGPGDAGESGEFVLTRIEGPDKPFGQWTLLDPRAGKATYELYGARAEYSWTAPASIKAKRQTLQIGVNVTVPEGQRMAAVISAAGGGGVAFDKLEEAYVVVESGQSGGLDKAMTYDVAANAEDAVITVSMHWNATFEYHYGRKK